MKTELVSQAQVGEICAKYHNAGFRLQTMIATDERATQSTYVLRYVFFHDEQQVRVTVESRLAASDPSYASATPMVPAAEWYEREALDLLGLIPLGHPQPDPLVLHGDRLSGLYPLRKDFPLEGPLPQVVRTLEQEPLSDGAFEVPVGPIHAGIIEPGHFRFQVRGEVVEALKATLFYTHRGLEKKAEGLSLAEGLALAEQACGVCSVSHGLSYAQAVESLAHMQVPEQARYTRVVWAEMERLYNHIGDVGNICAGIGFSFGTMQCGRLKEILQRLQAGIMGHRYLRGGVCVGGVTQGLQARQREQLQNSVKTVIEEFDGTVEAILTHEVVNDRFRQTGILTADAVRQWGVVGPAARASGMSIDVRKQQPYAAYGELADFHLPVMQEGDVMARVLQRIHEVHVSGQLMTAALSHLATLRDTATTSDLRAAIPSIEPFASGIGVSESPRGENVHFVMTDEHGQIARLRIRSASYANWPAVPETVPGNLIADFPLINKSFELCYACCDR